MVTIIIQSLGLKRFKVTPETNFREPKTINAAPDFWPLHVDPATLRSSASFLTIIDRGHSRLGMKVKGLCGAFDTLVRWICWIRSFSDVAEIWLDSGDFFLLAWAPTHTPPGVESFKATPDSP